jgi:RNA polymerase sigma-70 factor, ECF subfamily
MAELTFELEPGSKRTRRFVYKRVKDKAITEDIVHDVFLKVQDKIQHLRENEKVFGRIYQITRNMIIDHYRKSPKSISPGDIDWESSPPNFNDCVSSAIQELIPARKCWL